MAQTAIATGIETKGRDLVRQGGQDVVEHTLRRMDESVKKSTGVSLFHILTIGSIAASIALYVSGKKSLGIFVGLWPPTFEALKAVADKRERDFE
ncbi:MAG: hypothetical protein ABI954_05585 [Pyrinomonadaceae bacterium]